MPVYACLCLTVLDIFSVLMQLWLLYKLLFHIDVEKDGFVSKDVQK